MTFEVRCPQCVFVSRQLGKPTPCLLHTSLPDEGRSEAPIATTEPTLQVAAAYDEPYEFGRLRPTVDRPGPFSFREYVRLQLLRIRVEIEASPLDAATVRTEHPSLSAR